MRNLLWIVPSWIGLSLPVGGALGLLNWLSGRNVPTLNIVLSSGLLGAGLLGLVCVAVFHEGRSNIQRRHQ